MKNFTDFLNEEQEKLALYLDGTLQNIAKSVKGMRAFLGFITGEPTDAKANIDLLSFLLKQKGGGVSTFFKGKKVITNIVPFTGKKPEAKLKGFDKGKIIAHTR